MTAKTVDAGPARVVSWRHGLAALAVALLIVAALGAGFAIGYQEAFANRVVPGVTVDGVSIGGLDRAAAEGRLRAQLPNPGQGTLVLQSSSGDATLSFSRLGRAYDYGAILDLALAVAHGGDLSSRVSQDVRALVGGEQVVPRLTYKRAALASAVAGVAGAHDVSATDAMVVLGPDGNFVVVPAAQGRVVDRQAVVEAAGIGLLAPGVTRVTVRLRTVEVSPGVTTQEAAAALQAANQMTAEPLTLTVSTNPKFSLTIPPDTLRTWVFFGPPQPAAPEVPPIAPPGPSGAPDGSSAPGADTVPVVGAPPAASTAAPAGPPIAWPSSAARVVGDLPALPTPATTPSVVSSSASPAPVTGPGPVTPQPPAPSGAAVASPGPASSPAVGPSPGTGAYVPLVGNATARVALAALAPKVARNPSDASYLLSAGKVIGVLAARDGAQLDVDASLSAISAALSSRTEGSPAGTVQLAVTTVAPALSTDEAKKTAPLMKVVGSWTTHFFPGISNYWGKNISIPAATIDGYVVAPGAWFDFWKVVGMPSPAEGYGLGGEIINGHTDETGAIGGGICSTSTTLFNAALRAGYQIGDRANHYYYISRYPVGLDATVAMGPGWEQDMTWRNDTAYPVLIHAINGPGTVTFQLFSVDPQRTVTLSTPIVKNYTYATTKYVMVTTLPPGQENQVEYASNGFDAWVTRTVTDATGTVIHQETYYSHYATVNGLIEVGVAQAPSPSPSLSGDPAPSPSPSPSPGP
jgi:vancomycin resistance protein YoaR